MTELDRVVDYLFERFNETSVDLDSIRQQAVPDIENEWRLEINIDDTSYEQKIIKNYIEEMMEEVNDLNTSGGLTYNVKYIQSITPNEYVVVLEVEH